MYITTPGRSPAGSRQAARQRLDRNRRRLQAPRVLFRGLRLRGADTAGTAGRCFSFANALEPAPDRRARHERRSGPAATRIRPAARASDQPVHRSGASRPTTAPPRPAAGRDPRGPTPGRRARAPPRENPSDSPRRMSDPGAAFRARFHVFSYPDAFSRLQLSVEPGQKVPVIRVRHSSLPRPRRPR